MDYPVSPGSELAYQQLNLTVDGVGLTVATVGRDGGLAPIVFLHGFGSTKEGALPGSTPAASQADHAPEQGKPHVMLPPLVIAGRLDRFDGDV